MGLPYTGYVYPCSFPSPSYVYITKDMCVNIYIYIYIFTSTCEYRYICIYEYGPLGKPEADDVNNFANRALVPAKSSEMVVHYKDSNGVDRIKGGRDMKASQAYPKMCFGQIMF